MDIMGIVAQWGAYLLVVEACLDHEELHKASCLQQCLSELFD